MEDPPSGGPSLRRRVNLAIQRCIESSQAMQEPQYDGCYIPEINQFYLNWHQWVTAPTVVLGTSPEFGVWLRPNDEFCPLCDLAERDIDFDGMYEKLNTVMQRVMQNALQRANSLDEAVLDTWRTYMTEFCPRIRGAQPSGGSKNAGCIFDCPSITCNTLIDHYSNHVMPPNNILLPYMLDDANVQWACRVVEGVFDGTHSHRDIETARRILNPQAPQSMIQKLRN